MCFVLMDFVRSRELYVEFLSHWKSEDLGEIKI